MNNDNIKELGIDDKERLYIKPQRNNFEFIYRDASGVNWNEWEKFLYAPQPEEWSYHYWYRQILMAVKNEYGCELVLTDETIWTNVSEELKQQICRT